MKIIHCADLHLDSRLTTHLTPQLARQRKTELLRNFKRLVDYAQNKRVAALIIAGDLFDTPIISATARNLVLDEIQSHSQIKFYYLPGNHETDSFLEAVDHLPDNLLTFGTKWQSYELANLNNWRIMVSGLNINDPQFQPPLTTPKLETADFNLVVLHGQISQYQNRNLADNIALNQLANQAIDYLALGHLHQYQSGSLPPRGKYCYAGCLEGRGFDELGEHGFVELTINEQTHQWQSEFVPFAQRRLFEIGVDITNCQTTMAVEKQIQQQLQSSSCSARDLLKIVLTGSISETSEHSLLQLQQDLQADYYFVKVVDQSKIAVDYHQYLNDISLKGEFVRLLQQDQTLDEQQRAKIIHCGLRALNGEELEECD
ncbi:metallophosphoesterase family protein [Liquorilactobacillus vini]|uniref:Calcineurin-like phosphoesterase domain-containing protein n=1 Tax=Liquorilactobacillus vini DSM 20605 TaxID=1133569 RepID=A0A0R2CDE9_9LACO|nr:DNA repair exonuclease [Liquorilactobacillus vini]KRM89575.1 hypothetical protein FD21_GL001083 [Liquorilactobacillus vini DSM 20605]